MGPYQGVGFDLLVVVVVVFVFAVAVVVLMRAALCAVFLLSGCSAVLF